MRAVAKQVAGGRSCWLSNVKSKIARETDFETESGGSLGLRLGEHWRARERFY